MTPMDQIGSDYCDLDYKGSDETDREEKEWDEFEDAT